MDDCPLWTPPASPILVLAIVRLLCIGLAGACRSLTSLCLSVRRSPVRPRGATGTTRSLGAVFKPLRLQYSLKGDDAATLRGIPSALAEFQRNPEQPEPPRVSSRYAKPLRSTRGSGGKRLFCALTFAFHFRLRRTPHWGVVARECPRRLWPLSTRESGSLLQKKSTSKENTHPPVRHLPLTATAWDPPHSSCTAPPRRNNRRR